MNPYKYILGLDLDDNPVMAVWHRNSPFTHKDMADWFFCCEVQAAGFIFFKDDNWIPFGMSESLRKETPINGAELCNSLDKSLFFTTDLIWGHHKAMITPIILYSQDKLNHPFMLDNVLVQLDADKIQEAFLPLQDIVEYIPPVTGIGLIGKSEQEVSNDGH